MEQPHRTKQPAGLLVGKAREEVALFLHQRVGYLDKLRMYGSKVLYFFADMWCGCPSSNYPATVK